MSGYIGNIPTPQATQTRDTFTATAGQTTFATSGYTPSFLDVFMNGAKLVSGSDFTATNGSDVVLTSGAAAGDTLEVVAYSTYQVNSQNYTGGLTVDNDGATVLTVDRATSDGTIIDLQKDGSSVGSIGTQNGSDFFIGSSPATIGLRFQTNEIVPVNATAANKDASIDIGKSNIRFKNLWLSGGVYLGGTGAANYLDDYEEGTWTPALTSSGGTPSVTYVSRSGKYTKVGNMVHASFQLRVSSHSGGSGEYRVAGLPFGSTTAGSDHIGVSVAGFEGHPIGSTEQLIQVMDGNSFHVRMLKAQSNTGWTSYTPNSNFAIWMSFSYPTAS